MKKRIMTAAAVLRTVEWLGKVDDSFPQELLAELAEAFRNDEVQEFVSRYEADYQILI